MSKTTVAHAEKVSKKPKQTKQDAEENLKSTKRAKPEQTADSAKSKKKRDGDDAEPTPRSVKSVLNLEERSFPRGGASVLTPIERKQIQIEADRDALFEESGKKRPLPTDVSDDEVAGEIENDSKPKKKRKTKSSDRVQQHEPAEKVERIESLSFRKLVAGSLVLGQVAQISSRDVAIALPNNITGYVPLTSISRQLNQRMEKLLEEAEKDGGDAESDVFEDVDIKKLFTLGQYLRVYVVSNDDMRGGKHKKHIELSLDPALTNSGLSKDDLVVNSTVQVSVASVEDGGLVVDMGIGGMNAKGFVAASDVGSDIKHSDVEEGAVLLCVVTGHSGNGRVIKLSCDAAKMGDVKKGHTLTNAPSVNTFLPGTSATVLISEVTNTGIRGSIMGMLDVTADFAHAGGAQGRQELEKRFKVGSKVPARVLFSFPKNESQKIGVSLVEHVISLSSKCLNNKHDVPPLQQLRPSAIVEEAKVVKVDPRNGVYLDVGVPRVHAFAHISRLSDKKVDNLAGETGPFKIDSMHRVRVLGYSAIDGLFSVSLEESTLSQPFLRMEDVNPGELVDGTIEELPVKGDGVSGILLRLAEGIRGFVPADHLADVKLKHPERKYRPGMKVKARVLSTNTDKRSIYLTMKKSLVGSEATPWTSFDDLQVGGQSPGTITKLTPSGAWIQFYGEVRAFLPVGEMSEAFIRDPREHFRVGQVVSVHIISVDQDNKRMLVSCKDPASNSKERELKFKELKVGQIVSASIIELAKDLVTLDLDDGIQGHLRVSHLTDGSEKKNNSALSKLRAGMKLQDLVILQKLAGTRAVRLSNKPTLVKAARKGKLPTSLDQLKQGKKVDGFISSVTATGIFVEFGDNFTGLIPVSGMPDTMRQLKMQNFGMQTGQSVTAAVWKIYLADNRFTLTLREDEFVQSAKDGPADAPRAPRELENPVDSKLTNINELTIGTQTFARVNAVKELQLNISLADNVNGRIHVTEVFKDLSEIDDPKKPLQTIKHNSTLPVTVIGLHDARTYKFLPIGHRQSVHPVYECSRKQSDTSEPYTLSLLKLTEGEERLAFIYKYTNSQALASLSPDINGTIDVVDLASMDVDYQRAFPIGSAIQVKIRKIDADKNKLYLVPASARSWSERTIEEGRVYVGHVRRSHAEGLDIELAKNVWGMVPLTELADDYDQARPESWSARDAVKVKVLARLENQDGLILSARPSLTSSSTESIVVKDRHVTGNADVKTCEVIRGYVKKVSKQGMLVRLGWNATAQIPVHELADAYVKNFASVFKPRQLVTGKITKADADDGHHKMSLRDSVVKDTNFKPQLNFADIEVGQIVDAVVVKVESYGVFVLVRNSRNIRGLCHVKELASTRVEDPSKLYSEGDKVKAKIIKLDMAKRHVNFSLKAMHFQDIAEGDVEQGDGEDADEDHEMGGVDLDNVLDADSEDEEAGADGEMEVVQEVSASKKRISSAGLKTTGFDWTGTADAEDEDAPQPGVGEELPKKKRRKVEIQVDKTGDLDKLGPQSVSDFERLLLGQPNSSALWIQYMAFQLGLSEVDKAREVAERALKTIHMREEEEKMNIWTALLNLENTYGGEESLEGVFERACEYSDKKEVSQRLASIYIDSSKHKEAENLFDRMRKNRDISSDPNYWLNYATFLMTTMNRPEDARALLQRATQSVPTHQHAHLISRFGALEFQSPHGDIERGRTIFEGLVDTYKNGHDLWDQYLAQEMGSRGDVEKARALFERMAKMKMRPKRARYMFKKWLDWERKLTEEGTASDKSVARVKFLAEEYVGGNGAAKA